MMLWITTIALVLGAANRLGILKLGQLREEAGEAFIMGIGFALVGLLSVCGVFQRRLKLWLRMPVVAILIPVLGWLTAMLAFGDEGAEEIFTMMFCGKAALVVSALFLCRLSGYQIERVVRNPTP